MTWTDTHCHLDAPEFGGDAAAVVARARAAGVTQLVLPAIEVANVETVRALAHEHGLAWAAGIHPLCTARAGDDDVARIAELLQQHADDPRLVTPLC
jgi:TatD DNase family protein